MSPKTHTVYTDGSCLYNGTQRASAGIGVFFGVDSPRNISRKLVADKVSNNVAEVRAILAVLDEMREELARGDKVVIYTDSTYAIWACVESGKKMAGQGWKTKQGRPIPNAELVQIAWNTCKDLPNLKLEYVQAHKGKGDVHSVGNAWADKLAVEGAGGRKVFLQPPKETAPRRPSRVAEAGQPGKAGCAGAGQASKDKKEVVWLDVPYASKDEAKRLGAWWNPNVRRWYAPPHLDEARRGVLSKRWG
jgi:ribonuclease HI